MPLTRQWNFVRGLLAMVNENGLSRKDPFVFIHIRTCTC